MLTPTRQLLIPSRDRIDLDPADPAQGIGEWSAFALDLARRRNDRPTLFAQSDRVVRLKPTARGWRIEDVNATALRWHLTDWGNWRTVRHLSGGRTTCKPAAIELLTAIAQNILAAPNLDPGVFPPLGGVVEAPAFDHAGRLLCRPGYDPASGFWYEPPKGLTLAPIPDLPSRKSVMAAVKLLTDHLLIDFPFVGDADRAHALAMLLLPSCRRLVEGPTPLHSISAPTPATGKTLLAQLVGIAPTGRETPLQSEKPSDDELRKVITTELREGAPIIALDNLHSEIAGSAWASALTANHWRDRVLGSSRSVDVPVLPVWISTANTPTYSGELARRSISIVLDAEMEDPGTRDRFVHPLPSWALRHRSDLLRAILLIIQSWVAAGQRPGRARLASFESWAGVMSGILDSIGVEGFLAHGSAGAAETADTDGHRWRELVRSWLAWHDLDGVPIRVILKNINGDDVLKVLFADILGVARGDERVELMRLKEALDAQAGRILSGHRIVPCHPMVAGTPTRFVYELAPADQAPWARPLRPVHRFTETQTPELQTPELHTPIAGPADPMAESEAEVA